MNMDEIPITEAAVDAFEHCTHGIAIGLPGSNKLLTCNPAFAQMQGRTVEEIRDLPILEMYDPAEHEHVKSCIAQADSAGKVSYESRMIRKDGTTYPVQMDLVTVRDAGGTVLYRVATQQDISERVRVAGELSVMVGQVRAKSKTVGASIVGGRFKGLYTWLSPMAEKVWGYQPRTGRA